MRLAAAIIAEIIRDAEPPSPDGTGPPPPPPPLELRCGVAGREAPTWEPPEPELPVLAFPVALPALSGRMPWLELALVGAPPAALSWLACATACGDVDVSFVAPEVGSEIAAVVAPAVCGPGAWVASWASPL